MRLERKERKQTERREERGKREKGTASSSGLRFFFLITFTANVWPSSLSKHVSYEQPIPNQPLIDHKRALSHTTALSPPPRVVHNGEVARAQLLSNLIPSLELLLGAFAHNVAHGRL